VVRYDPKTLIRKLAPPSKIKKLMTKGASLKKTALSFLDEADFLDRDDIAETALKVIQSYRKRFKEDGDLKQEIIASPALLIQRVQNEVISQVKEKIEKRYQGEFYIWLPSNADEPDPEHQLNYGKRFQVGVGEMPGDRYGCQCGMEIIVDDDKLDL
jgi:hypothetical protein